MALVLGAEMPEFELPSDAGGLVSLSGLKGRHAVLFFYPKDDTSSCTQESADFSALLAEFGSLGVFVAGVSPDSVKKHGRFRAKHGLTVTLLSDEAKALIPACGLWVEKSMYGHKYMGVERTTLLIDPAGKIAGVWEKVKVPGHAGEVLGAVRQLTARLGAKAGGGRPKLAKTK